jgi:4-hydroxy-tetrahydrodipicolinate synthase
VEVIVPCGNTGEFYALTVEEAQAVTQFVVEKVAGRARPGRSMVERPAS